MVIARVRASSGSTPCQLVGERLSCFTRPALSGRSHAREFWDRAAPTDASVERMRAKLAQREFFQTVLGASATKRDAKQFLAKFDPKHSKSKIAAPAPHPTPAPAPAPAAEPVPALGDARVNLGSLYRPNKAVAESPRFSFIGPEQTSLDQVSTLNLAIVKVFEPHKWPTKVVHGVAKTLGQLAKLGLRIAVVVDEETDDARTVMQNCRDLTKVLNDSNEHGALLVDQAFTLAESSRTLELSMSGLILSPLRKGAITVLPTAAHNEDCKAVIAPANKVILALAKFMAVNGKGHDLPWPVEISLDRIIFLDRAGGITNSPGDKQSHVFVNIMQDYDGIHSDLAARIAHDATDHEARRQLADLVTLQECLALLPATSSALFATPLEVALSGNREAHEDTLPGVSTRSQRNMLIHNILTDKPLVSSSLPLARLHGPGPAKGKSPTSTFFKYGMPVRIVPEITGKAWANPGPGGTSLDLRKSDRIDLAKLVHLIEDSFGRKLDVDSYLSRIQNHIAGVIVVGDYEGGAILTWEKPTGDRAGRPLVPYLDKFAVLRRCQGSGGVADIVFNAMVRQCFPDGVVWRSRRDNPVNKWYFERSNGTWHLPGSNWTMFWTGNEAEMRLHGGAQDQEWSERWKDYVSVCSNIKPSWANTNSAA